MSYFATGSVLLLKEMIGMVALGGGRLGQAPVFDTFNPWKKRLAAREDPHPPPFILSEF